MTHKSLNKRLNSLENKTLKPIEPGSTKLDVTELPHAEQLFFEEAERIAAKLRRDENYEPTKTELKLINIANKRILVRVIDLFESAMKIWFHIDTERKKFLWYVRFWYFMMEFARHITQAEAEERIEKQTKTWRDYDKEWQKYRGTLTEEEKIPLWSDESFSHFMDTYCFRSWEEVKKRKRKAKKHG